MTPNGIRRDFPLSGDGIKCQEWVVAFDLKPLKGEVLRAKITRVGADLAKRVIQVHAVDASGKLVGRGLDARIIPAHLVAPCRLQGCALRLQLRLRAIGQREEGRPAACKAGRKERCQPCRCHLRSGIASADAFCADQERRAAKHVVCAPPARRLRPYTNSPCGLFVTGEEARLEAWRGLQGSRPIAPPASTAFADCWLNSAWCLAKRSFRGD